MLKTWKKIQSTSRCQKSFRLHFLLAVVLHAPWPRQHADRRVCMAMARLCPIASPSREILGSECNAAHNRQLSHRQRKTSLRRLCLMNTILRHALHRALHHALHYTLHHALHHASTGFASRHELTLSRDNVRVRRCICW